MTVHGILVSGPPRGLPNCPSSSRATLSMSQLEAAWYWRFCTTSKPKVEDGLARLRIAATTAGLGHSHPLSVLQVLADVPTFEDRIDHCSRALHACGVDIQWCGMLRWILHKLCVWLAGRLVKLVASEFKSPRTRTAERTDECDGGDPLMNESKTADEHEIGMSKMKEKEKEIKIKIMRVDDRSTLQYTATLGRKEDEGGPRVCMIHACLVRFHCITHIREWHDPLALPSFSERMLAIGCIASCSSCVLPPNHSSYQ